MAEDPGGGGEKRIRRDYFSEEIISEILARLPVKSLLRFRELQFPVKFPVGYKINGALHWLVRGSRIVSFSVAEEKFEEMVPLLDHDRVFQGVLVYKDHLCVYEIKDGAPGFVSIWLMEEYGNGEILMHRILYDVYDDPDPDPDPYEFDYHDPDEFEYPEYPYPDPDEFDYPDPDPFDDPEVYDDPYEFDYPDPDPFDDPEVYDDPYKFDDPYEEFDYYDYNQETWEREISTLVLVDQTSWEYVFEVDLGLGAAIYKETLVSPLTAGSTADI
ncbi:hypothetical protein ACLB2K_054207 [Fragaria x ananassa]